MLVLIAPRCITCCSESEVSLCLEAHREAGTNRALPRYELLSSDLLLVVVRTGWGDTHDPREVEAYRTMSGEANMELSSRAHDIFLSHRGPDKKDFCAFLKEALYRAGVHAFVDELDLKVGNPNTAWSTMQTMLQGARYVMPVISQGYLESRWCLDELVLMMQSPASVMPVFYDIGPDKDALVMMLSRCVYLPAYAHYPSM